MNVRVAEDASHGGEDSDHAGGDVPGGEAAGTSLRLRLKFTSLNFKLKEPEATRRLGEAGSTAKEQDRDSDHSGTEPRVFVGQGLQGSTIPDQDRDGKIFGGRLGVLE